MRCRYLFFSAVLAALCCRAWAGTAAVSYHITAEVDVDRKRITGRQAVSFSNQSDQPLPEVYFHLYPNRQYTPDETALLFRYGGYFKADPYPSGFRQGDLSVSVVRSGGDALDFFVEGDDRTLLRVVLSEPLAPGGRAALEMDFSAAVPQAYGRFGWHEDIIKAAYWHPVLSVQDASGRRPSLFYPFHRPFYTDAAVYDVSLTVPDGFIVAHSGEVVQEEAGGGRKTVVIRTGLPVRAFAFAMSPSFRWKESRYKETVLRCYYLQGMEDRAERALEHLQTVFAFYEEKVGAYPYSRFTLVPVHLGYGGEQMANMAFLDTRVFHLPGLLERQFDFLIAHETGHQWFYNMVGVDGSRELWLEEAVVSYFTLEYIERKYGDGAQILEYPEWFRPYAWLLPELSFRRIRDYRYQVEARMGYDGPLLNPLEAYEDPSRIFSVIYGKGVRVFEALRARIGEEALSRVFHRAVREFRFGNWSSRDFFRLSGEESGQDLSDFFEQWILGAGHADDAVRVSGRRLILMRKGSVVQPVNVEVVLADGSRESFIWEGDGTEVRRYAQDIRRASVDRAGKNFDLDRTNNVWPRRVRAQIVPLYVGLYDVPLFLPDDTYHLIAGPQIRDGIGAKAAFQKPYDYTVYGGTGYRLGEDLWTFRAGFLKRNIGASPLSAGAEVMRVKDLDTGREDLTGVKVYARQDFQAWPYGLFTLQDHATVYVIRNQRLNADNEALHSGEDDRNLEYRRREESIVGASLHLDRSAPYPDPKQGFRLNISGEHGGHFLGGGQYFYRGALDGTAYYSVTPRSKIVSRLKVGMGFPDDKDLFQLGGSDGLRGYPRKSLRGANALLGVVEYRMPLVDGLNVFLLDNIVGMQRVDAAVFAEAGRAWFASYADAEWKTDAGAGVRFHVDIGGFLEKVIIQIDAAHALNDSGQRTRFWLSVNSLF